MVKQKKTRWKGIGGRPSKQMKELQKKPLPIELFKIDNPKPPNKYYFNIGKSVLQIMDETNKFLDAEITRLTDKKCQTSPPKTK